MKLVDETKTLKYREVLFGELEEGDVFENDQGFVWMAIHPVSYQNDRVNAIRLKDGDIIWFYDSEVVYPLNATLHYERILEGAE